MTVQKIMCVMCVGVRTIIYPMLDKMKLTKNSTIKFYKDSDKSYTVTCRGGFVGAIGLCSDGLWHYSGNREHADIVAKVNELNGEGT